jgi:hypothetical protein
MSLANRNLLLRGCTSPEPHARGLLSAKLYPRIQARHGKKARPCSPCVLASKLRAPSSTGTLIQIRFSQRRGAGFSVSVVPGDSCHVETPAKPSIHSTRIEQSPNLPDPWVFGSSITQSPCLCHTHVSPACEGATVQEEKYLFVCKAVAPKNHSPRAAAGSREGLVVLQSTYLWHGILCVTLGSSTKSGQ